VPPWGNVSLSFRSAVTLGGELAKALHMPNLHVHSTADQEEALAVQAARRGCRRGLEATERSVRDYGGRGWKLYREFPRVASSILRRI
jgi:hypothetical protein